MEKKTYPLITSSFKNSPQQIHLNGKEQKGDGLCALLCRVGGSPAFPRQCVSGDVVRTKWQFGAYTADCRTCCVPFFIHSPFEVCLLLPSVFEV